MERVDCRKDAAMTSNLDDPGYRQRQEPHQHDKSEKLCDRFRTLPLESEEQHANQDSQRNAKRGQPVGGNRQPLCGGEHRNRRRDNSISVEKGRSDKANPSLTLSGNASDSSARIPPSPWLSARITNVRYLNVTSSVRVQMMRDRIPKISS